MWEYKNKLSSAFVWGNVFGLMAYTGATKMQSIPFVRRPWHLLATVIGTGVFFQLYDNLVDAVREDLFRKRIEFVQQRQARYLDSPQKEANFQRKMYDQIVRDLEATGTEIKK